MGGQIDATKVVENQAELERVIRLATDRSDIQVGKVRNLSVFR